MFIAYLLFLLYLRAPVVFHDPQHLCSPISGLLKSSSHPRDNVFPFLSVFNLFKSLIESGHDVDKDKDKEALFNVAF